MQQFEIFPGERIFIVLAQIAQVVGIVEILESRGISSVLFVVVANGSRVLHSAVDHLLFPLPLHVKLKRNHHRHRDDAHQSDDQQQSQQHVAVFYPAAKP